MVNMSCDLLCLIFCHSWGIENGKQLMTRKTRIIVLKLRIKMSRCCIILNNLLRN